MPSAAATSARDVASNPRSRMIWAAVRQISARRPGRGRLPMRVGWPFRADDANYTCTFSMAKLDCGGGHALREVRDFAADAKLDVVERRIHLEARLQRRTAVKRGRFVGVHRGAVEDEVACVESARASEREPRRFDPLVERAGLLSVDKEERLPASRVVADQELMPASVGPHIRTDEPTSSTSICPA